MRFETAWLLATICVAFAIPPADAACPPDSAQVGAICVDKYEGSSWLIPTSNEPLIQKVQAGTAMLTDLTTASATQLGCTGQPYRHTAYPADFPANGNWSRTATSRVYAVSLPGIYPSACTTWFQAEQACALSGKRLLTNAEWQQAVAGTPKLVDDHATTCNIGESGPQARASLTGARSTCVSDWNVYDMLGNVEEWVGDWTVVPNPTGPPGLYSVWLDGSLSFLGGAPAGSQPAALVRGSKFASGFSDSGDFYVYGVRPDTLLYLYPGLFAGYRCAR